MPAALTGQLVAVKVEAMSDRPTYFLRPPSRAAANFRLDYEQLLNPAQMEAVAAGSGPVLVIAGAGSGKTRTLVFRVARLIETGADPRSILLLTFTRKASAEMLRRATALLDGRCADVAGGTFHSFANSVLRRRAALLGMPHGFSILDRGDCEDVVNLVRAMLGLDARERRFPRKQTIASLFSMAVNKSVSLPVLIESSHSHLAEHIDDLVALRTAYDEYKRERALLDYDDLLLSLHQLLHVHPALRDELSQQYRFIMVDEYQDTNPLQAAIVRLLAAQHDNVMAVGDDAQSIYGFRGASFRNIMDFPDLFPGTRVITLEENYRSTQPILDLTNRIIAAASERYSKTLFTRQDSGDTPLLIAAENENYQSRFVCQRILDLREEGVPLDEMAVLFRSSFHAFDLELELVRHDIPFIKRGGFKFIETAHVKDALAHLRIIANPRDVVSWNRALLILEGIGPRKAQGLIGELAGATDPAAVLTALAERPQNGALRALGGLLRTIAGGGGMLPEAQLSAVLTYYEPHLKRLYRDDYPKRLRDLEHMVSIAARYRALDTMLADMALEPPNDSVGDVLAVDDGDELLTLSTIHSAKGLEWHSVFILWAVDGRFPSMQSMHDEAELEEERRLLYVAATRAKRNLYISYPVNMYDRASGMILSKPSRFLDDIPVEVLTPMRLEQR